MLPHHPRQAQGDEGAIAGDGGPGQFHPEQVVLAGKDQILVEALRGILCMAEDHRRRADDVAGQRLFKQICREGIQMRGGQRPVLFRPQPATARKGRRRRTELQVIGKVEVVASREGSQGVLEMVRAPGIVGIQKGHVFAVGRHGIESAVASAGRTGVGLLDQSVTLRIGFDQVGDFAARRHGRGVIDNQQHPVIHRLCLHRREGSEKDAGFALEVGHDDGDSGHGDPVLASDAWRGPDRPCAILGR